MLWGSVCAALWVGSSVAQGLYEAAPPPDSTFVRVINVQTGVAPLSPIVGGKTLLTVAAKGHTDYYALPKGDKKYLLGKLSGSVALQAGKFYSLVVSGEAAAPKMSVLEDPIPQNKARALINFYNLSSAPNLSLKTSDGKTTVIDKLEAGKVGSRAVNPLKVSLSAFADTQPLATLKDTAFERGFAYTLLAMGTPEKLELVWFANKMAKG
jgi:alginate O-acetyltransferase complex protein AlgF